jgi:hypothetical protein
MHLSLQSHLLSASSRLSDSGALDSHLVFLAPYMRLHLGPS